LNSRTGGTSTQYQGGWKGNLNRFLGGNLSKAVLLFLGYLGIQFLLQPRWLTSGGMWAENATVFFSTAVDGFQLSDLIVLDAGYLPTFLHLVAAILALFGLPASEMGFVYNWAGLILASLPVIAFQMPIFRKLIASDPIRSLVIILILAFQSYWSTSNFLNSSYSMIFLLLICGLYLTTSAVPNDDELQKSDSSLPSWLLLLAPLLVFTKPATLAIVPLYFYLLFVLRGKPRMGAAAVVLAGLVQVIVLASSRFQNRVFEQVGDFDLGTQSLNALLYFTAFPFRILAGPAWTDVLLGRWWSENLVGLWWSENNISLIFGALVILGSLVLAKRSSNLSTKIWIWVSLAMMLSASVLNNFTLWDIWNQSFYLYDAVPLHSRSLTMYLFTLSLFVGIAMALFAKLTEARADVTRGKWLKWISPNSVVIVWLVGSGWALYIPLFADEPKWPAIGSSNWATSELDAEGKFTQECVVIEPWAWGVYGDRCTVAERSEHSQYVTSALTTGAIGFSSAASNYPEDFLKVVAFNVDAESQGYVSYSLRIDRGSGSDPLLYEGLVPVNEGGATVIVNIPDKVAFREISKIEVSVADAVLFTRADGSSPNQILSFLIGRE
jgi:hypothetical protein